VFKWSVSGAFYLSELTAINLLEYMSTWSRAELQNICSVKGCLSHLTG